LGRNKKMTKELTVFNLESIKSKIYSIRGVQVMLDTDLAELYGVLTGNLNKAVKRNIQRFLASNVQIFQRMDRTEQKLLEHYQKFEEIFDAIQSKDIKPEKGIFFDGQIFDAYKFVSDIIRTAESSIILIDNHIDDSVLTLFSKRNKNVQITIFTKEISSQLALDIAKYNSQYPPIEVKEFKQSHDRFIIIDNKEGYHFGASLKDLGKKWFGFSKFDKEAFKSNKQKSPRFIFGGILVNEQGDFTIFDFRKSVLEKWRKSPSFMVWDSRFSGFSLI
jgi:hypothetical protein